MPYCSLFAWAADEKVKLLASKLEYRKSDEPPPADKKDDAKESDDPAKTVAAKKTDKKLPLAVPGVFLKAAVDDDHFVTWGIAKETVLHFNGDRIFAPLKALEGKNLVAFAGAKDLLVSGYC